jgi:undecaprenyl-diphosphatase
VIRRHFPETEMTLLHLAVLALIQGITEFLPISSSAHLILEPALTGGRDQGLTIDAAVHAGTLAAVMLYFRGDMAAVIRGGLRVVTGDLRDPEARLALLLALATVPVVLSGAAVALTGLDVAFRSVELIAWTTLIWGAVLWLSDRFGATGREFAGWNLRDAIVMGLAQAISIVPGTSRSGITMSAARALGFARVDAARLSMLMSVPATMAVAAWTGAKLARSGDTALGLDAAIAAGMSFVAALFTLIVLMRMLRTWTMTPFVIYRLALGGVLLWVAYG